MSRSSKNRNSKHDDDDKYYQLLDKEKDEKLGAMVDETKQMKKDVILIGNMVEADNERLDAINNKVDGMINKGQRNLNKMQHFLERTSNCKLYIILGIELFIFIALMSL